MNKQINQKKQLVSILAVMCVSLTALLIGITAVSRQAERQLKKFTQPTVRTAYSTTYLVEKEEIKSVIPLTLKEQNDLKSACDEFEVEYALMLSLIEQETDFENTIGDNGESLGYCQIDESWWQDLMKDINTDDLMNPQDNFRTACAILSSLEKQYGCIECALTYYNTGSPGQSDYADTVLENADRWRI